MSNELKVGDQAPAFTATAIGGDYGEGRLRYPLFPRTSVAEFDQIILRAGFNEPGPPFIRDELTRRQRLGQVAPNPLSTGARDEVGVEVPGEHDNSARVRVPNEDADLLLVGLRLGERVVEHDVDGV